ncbi:MULTISPECIES: histidine--tRNA ligase [unclassified Nocardioides]|uniref:histidine--tRNA ligase n=1 Tax=unclassified Nocardioides TaxID=2615069 RepID=UPI0006F3B650|nr:MULTISPECIES: histidine--tRNA ligase [unclassified Nocardioides]KQY64223.1 histidine--tRNA ligase [Nocardioides sp. Root140]KQZ70143.1 histidine--tRNA ligase [Nocardioides sp. Root151]
MSRTTPKPMSGFPEFLPAQREVERQVIDTLSRTFELHGFANVETRAVEPMDQLLRKGDTSKEVYVLRRLNEESDEGHAGIGLHFDLTVPFARYVLENAGKLEFPFRRYQIQKVWRGERPQDGRFREFVQADIDVVGQGELPFHHDVEVTRVMLQALGRLADPGSIGLPGFTLQVNNRKLIQGFYQGLGITDVDEAMRLIDKLDKMPADVIGKLLRDEAGLTDEQADQCLALAAISSDDDSFVGQVRALGVSNDLLDEGLAELAELVRACAGVATDRVRIRAELKIARGLDYYTGTVFETRLDGYENLGSICSGGRYDSLASDGRTTYPGVGISLGVSRVLVPLVNKGLVVADRSVPSVVLVALPDEESRAASDAIADQLRANDVPCEVAASPQKFGKQIRYAERRGIPYVWFTDREGGHQVKDIRSGDQVPADPSTWVPPTNDLKPTIVHTDNQ